MKGVLVDTGPLVALVSAADQYHEICLETSREISGPLYSCWPVITEAAWLLRRKPGGVRHLLNILGSGAVELLPLGRADVAGIAAILERYADLGAPLADAALVQLAGRDHIDTIFTFDRRDFSVYRIGGRAFRIVPDLR